MSVRIEINGEKLKQYVSTSKSVSFTAEGCRLRSKTGKVTFDLSSFEHVCKCSVLIRKISGNGKVKISSGNSVSEVVSLGSAQGFDIGVGESGLVEVFRTKDGTGEVSVAGLAFDAEGEDSEVSQNWKSIIKRCGKYKSLRVVKGRLFATHGAFVEKGHLITNIETNPSNMYRRDDNKIFFTGSCEILKIDIDPSAQSVPQQNIDVFPSRKLPY